MKVTPENDPLEAYGFGPTLTVSEVMDFLDVSDGTARKFLKSHDLYIKVSGAIRVPRLGLAKVLYEREDTPEDSGSDVIDLNAVREAP